MTQLRQVISKNLQSDTSLAGLMNAVSALDQANATTNVLNPYRTQAKQLAQQQIQSGATQPLPWIATAKFALEDQNSSLFRSTTQELVQRFPDNPHGHYFQGVRAIEDGDWKSAEDSLRRAQNLGLADESLAELLKIAIDNQRWIWQYAQIIAAVIVVWLLGFFCLYLVGCWLSKKTLEAAERKDPSSRNAREHHLRTIYRVVINLTGIYYYISLPIILLTSIALPLSLGYAALMLPYLNLWLVAIILIGGMAGVITAISGLRTALVSKKYKPIRRLLTEEEAPKFWKLVRLVAERMKTRPVDEIWITPQTDMAVLEQGSWITCLMDRGKRTLLLGAGLLPGFKVDAMCSVLAHEYAHFQHRDTAGGDISLRVRIAMLRFADAIAERGVVRWWDITIWYLRYFYKLFNKLALGASRLQEVLADRVAVQHFGASALIEGLQHVIRRDVEFGYMLDEAIHQGTSKKRGVVAFYSPQKAIASHERYRIDSEVRDILQLPTTDEDTHPSPRERFAAARSAGVDKPVRSASVVVLFEDSAKKLVGEMNRMLDGLVGARVGQICNSDKHLLEYLNSEIKSQPAAELLEARATILYRAGEYDLALQDLNLILEHLPNDAAALLTRSSLFDKMGNYSRAADDLIKVRSLKDELPNDAQYEVASRYGELMLRCKKFSKAASAYNAAMRLDRKSLNAKVGRLIAAFGTGSLNEPEMLDLLRDVASRCPEEKILPKLFEAAGLKDEIKEYRTAQPRSLPRSTRKARVKSTIRAKLVTGLTVAAALCLIAFGGVFYWNSRTPHRQVSQATTTYQQEADPAPHENAERPGAKLPEDLEASETQEEPADDPAVLESDERLSMEPKLELTASSASVVSQSDPKSNVSDAQAKDKTIDSPEPPEIPDAPSANSASSEESESEPDLFEEPARQPPVLTAAQLITRAHNKMSKIGRAFRELDRKQLPMLKATTSSSDDSGFQLSWRVHLLPELGMQELYDAFHLDEPWDSEHNKGLIGQMPDVYDLQCSEGHTRFRVFRGKELFARLDQDSHRKDALDGERWTALAFLVGADQEVEWTKPDTESMSLRLPHKSLGITYREPTCILLVNGNTLMLEQGVHPQKLLALATARGGEKVARDTWFGDSRQATLPPPKAKLPHSSPGEASKPPTEQFVDIPLVRAPKLARNSDKLEQYHRDPIKQQMRSIALAMLRYEERHRTFPVPRKPQYTDAQGKPLLSWRVHLLPYLDQQVLYDRFKLDETWDSPHNQELAKYIPDIFKTDKDPAPLTRFQILSGAHLPYTDTRSPRTGTITDGTANTILFIQTGRDKAVPWTQPDDLELDLKKPRKSIGRIRGSLYCAMMGGKVLQLPAKVPDQLLAALATPRGGEVVDFGTVERYARHSARLPLATVDTSPEHVVQKLRQLSLAMLNYQERRKSLPMNIFHEGPEGELIPTLSWRVALLPFLEQDNLYKQFKRDEPWDSPHNRKLLAYMPDVFRDADDALNQNSTRIVTLTGPDTPFINAPKSKRSQGFPYRAITDGPSNTILMIQTVPESAVPWTKPADLPFDPFHPELSVGRFSPRHGLAAAFADGAVHIFPPSIELSKLKALVTPRGGELIGSWQ